MVTIALIGADGAGKTSVARKLEDDPTLKIKYLYMGDNPAASNHALPTTRVVRAIKRLAGRESHAGGPPDPSRARQRPVRLIPRLVKELKSTLRVCNQVAEEWYRQIIAWCHQRGGRIVVFDRHYYADRYAHDIQGRLRKAPFSSRLHGFLLEHAYPRPDLVILLDAPAAVLFARKGEGTLELVEQRRQEYFQLRQITRHFVVVDASRPFETVVDAVLAEIRRFVAEQKR